MTVFSVSRQTTPLAMQDISFWRMVPPKNADVTSRHSTLNAMEAALKKPKSIQSEITSIPHIASAVQAKGCFHLPLPSISQWMRANTPHCTMQTRCISSFIFNS